MRCLRNICTQPTDMYSGQRAGSVSDSRTCLLVGPYWNRVPVCYWVRISGSNFLTHPTDMYSGPRAGYWTQVHVCYGVRIGLEYMLLPVTYWVRIAVSNEGAAQNWPTSISSLLPHIQTTPTFTLGSGDSLLGWNTGLRMALNQCLHSFNTSLAQTCRLGC